MLRITVPSVKELYRKIAFPAWAFPAALLAVGLLAYGVLLPWLGFYWDDWAKIAVARLHGLGGYWPYYAEDRPLSSWTHIVFTPLVGFRPLGWHLLQFILKLLAAWGVYWVTGFLMPRRRGPAAVAALLFLVYPVFTAHPAAVTFHQQWLQYALILFSMGLMLAALSAASKGRFLALTALALLFMLLELTVTEYFASLEAIRPLLIWAALGQMPHALPARRARLLQTAARAAPYLLLLAAYGFWRFWLHPFSGRDPYGLAALHQLSENPAAALSALLPAWARDAAYTLVGVWGPLLTVGPLDRLTPFQILTLLFSLVALVITLVFLARFEPHPPAAGADASDRRPALWIGLAAFLLGMLPGWLTGHTVLEDFHADRYALPALLGAALLWAAALDWITPLRLQRALLAALLVGLSTGWQLRAANEYRWLWQTETRFFWQLYWRAPHLQAGTALFTYQEIFPNQGLFSSSSALNLLYPHPQKAMPASFPAVLSYWWYTLAPRYDINQLSEPIELKMSTQFRSLAFRGSTPYTLLVHYDPAHSNCLWVITDEDVDEPGLPPLVKAMRSISNTGQIRAEPLAGWRPPAEFFGPEPAHDWCYLYEKADLARQVGDWQRVAELGDQARAQGYSPADSRSNAPREWQPFIEGYARLGRWSEAAELTIQAARRGKEFQAPLARLWERLAGGTPEGAGKSEAYQAVHAVLYGDAP